MLTVPEAAAHVGRDPETVRRWIRAGRLRAQRVGTQHLVDEADLEILVQDDSLTIPEAWRRTRGGAPQPNWVSIIRRSRRGR